MQVIMMPAASLLFLTMSLRNDLGVQQAVRKVNPFGNLWIDAYFQHPEAFCWWVCSLPWTLLSPPMTLLQWPSYASHSRILAPSLGFSQINLKHALKLVVITLKLPFIALRLSSYTLPKLSLCFMYFVNPTLLSINFTLVVRTFDQTYPLLFLFLQWVMGEPTPLFCEDKILEPTFCVLYRIVSITWSL